MKKREMIRFHITRWILMKILLTAGLIVFCLEVWPGYLLHTNRAVWLIPGDVQQTPWLSVDDMIQQHFSPSGKWLSQIMTAVVFDENMTTDEYLIFSLWDETGKCLCSREIYFYQIENSNYFDIPINKKLKPGHQYVWTFTLAEPTELQYALMIGNIDSNASENCSLLINGEDTQQNAMSQYEYYDHYDKAQIFGGFWVGAIMIWLLLLEATDRAERLFKRKKQ